MQHISSGLILPNKEVNNYIVSFFDYIINKNHILQGITKDVTISNNIIKYDNQYSYQLALIKFDNSKYKIRISLKSSNISKKESSFEFELSDSDVYLQKSKDKIINNQFPIDIVKKSVLQYKNNLLAKCLQELEPMQKLQLIQCLNTNTINNKIFGNIQITFNNQKYNISFKGNNFVFNTLEELKSEILLLIKSYISIVGGTGNNINDILNWYNCSLDRYCIINNEEFKEKGLKELLAKNYIGYVYFQDTKKLYYIPKKLYQKQFESTDVIVNLYKKFLEKYHNSINFNSLFPNNVISSPADLQQQLENYLGFNLFINGPDLTGSSILKELREINEKLARIPKEYKKPIVLVGYSQGSFLLLEIAKSNPHLNFIVILYAPTKGLPNYGIFGQKKISYIPSNVTHAWVNYHGGIFPFFGDSILKTHPELDMRVDYYNDFDHGTINNRGNINDIIYPNVLLKLQSEFKRNYFGDHKKNIRNYGHGTNNKYIYDIMSDDKIKNRS